MTAVEGWEFELMEKGRLLVRRKEEAVNSGINAYTYNKSVL